MLDKVSDFFKDIKERLSNPFFSSFLIAWCIINWQIIIGLLFYKQSELKNDGYNSFIDLINCNINFKLNLLYPFLSAAGYTFLFPFFRNLILVVGAWFKTWGNERVLNVSKSGSISVYKYLKLREKYLSGVEDFVNLVKSENQYVIDNADLKKENASLTTQLNNQSDRLEYLNLTNKISYYKGEWELTLTPLTQYAGSSTSSLKVDIKITDDGNLKFKSPSPLSSFGYPIEPLGIKSVISSTIEFRLTIGYTSFI